MALNWTKIEAGYEAKANNGTETWTVERTKGGRFVLLSSFLDGVVMKGTLTDCKAHAEEASKAAFSGSDLTTPLPAEEFNELFRPEIAAAKSIAGKLPYEVEEDDYRQGGADFAEQRIDRVQPVSTVNTPRPSINDASPINAGKKPVCPVCGSDNVLFPGEKCPKCRFIPTPKVNGLASKIATQPSLKPNTDSAPHLIIEARAGTGKTTTIVEGLRFVMGESSKMVPSPQQDAIWREMAKSSGARTVAVVAFNKSIAAELQTRVPRGVAAMTNHSMGFRAVRNAFGSQIKPEEHRVSNIVSEILEQDIRQIRKDRFVLFQATEKLVGLCKMNLVCLAPSEAAKNLADLAAYYDVELADEKASYRAEVFELVPKVIERCMDVQRDGCVDFDDMVWLPVALDLPMTRYDLLCVDEAQDLNRCQQALARKSGHRLILVGDPKQAIYGFAGADAQSMNRMRDELSSLRRGPDGLEGGCVVLPLTETRRCGRKIVAEANKYVKDFTAHTSNPEGKVTERDMSDYHAHVSAGDMVLCRVNAPLVSQCFRFIKAGRKANIQGRDVAAGLKSTIKKTGATDVVTLVAKVSDWLHAETTKEQAKRNPSEQRIIALADRADCILCFTENCDTVDQVLARIDSVFTDDRSTLGIRLSSGHRAKGLEADKVFILMPKGAECPHPMAKSSWAREQEVNILYVMITRAREELIFVRD